jgi:hypothetical protein
MTTLHTHPFDSHEPLACGDLPWARAFGPTPREPGIWATVSITSVSSGTFVVRAPTSQARFRAEITRKLPFETSILFCKGKQIMDIAERDPFADKRAGSGLTCQ